MNKRVVMTIGINDLIERKVLSQKDLFLNLGKFINNDWGILCDEDKEFQDELVKNPNSKKYERFMGVYLINEIKIWIIREYDYSIDSLIFTILLPDEY